MPLTKAPTSDAFKSNLKAELGAGKSKKQALGIAYSIQEKAKGSSLKNALGQKKRGQ